MGTEKRQRQKELHREKMAQQEKELATANRKRAVINVVASIAAIAAVAVTIWFFTKDDSESVATENDDTTAETTTTIQPVGATITGPGAGAEITGETPCPEADGSSVRTTSFAQAPPTCIDKTKNYMATFETSSGEFTVELDAQNAPETVNNFVVLSRYHYYDGIPFHRIVPNFVVQAGDPEDTPTGQGGPGYSIGEEPPEDGMYNKYDLAMAKTSEPNSTGSQFFVVTGDPAPLNSSPTYSLFGAVTVGQDVVDTIGATKVGGLSDDSPLEQITIDAITISES